MSTSDQCASCRHYWGFINCFAYPEKRIPDKFLYGGERHNKVEDDQYDDFVFTEFVLEEEN